MILLSPGPTRSQFPDVASAGARGTPACASPQVSDLRSSVCRRTPCATCASRSTRCGRRPRCGVSREQVAAAPSVVGGLETVVTGHARRPLVVDPALAEVVRRVRRGEWVATIAPAIGLSTRQLQRRALDVVRLRPEAAVADPAPRRRVGPGPAGCCARRGGGAVRLRRSGAPRRRRASAGRHHARPPRPRGAGSAVRCARAGRRTGRRGCRRGRGPWRSADPRTRPTAPGDSRGRRRRGRRGRCRRRPDRRSRTPAPSPVRRSASSTTCRTTGSSPGCRTSAGARRGAVTSTCGSASAPTGNSIPKRR